MENPFIRRTVFFSILLPLLLFATYCNSIPDRLTLRTIWLKGLPDSIKSTAKTINLNQHDELGYTPLIWACKGNNGNAISSLIEAGADVNFRSRNGGLSPLMFAVLENDKIDVIEVLLRSSVDKDAVDDSGKTALIYAMAPEDKLSEAKKKFRGQAIVVLLQNGANPFIKDNAQKTALDYRTENTYLSKDNDAVKFLARYSDPQTSPYLEKEENVSFSFKKVWELLLDKAGTIKDIESVVTAGILLVGVLLFGLKIFMKFFKRFRSRT